MNEYVISVNKNRYELKINDNHQIFYNGGTFGISLSKVSPCSYLLKIGDKVYDITSHKLNNEEFIFSIDGFQYDVTIRSKLEELAKEFLSNKEKLSHHDEVRAPMPGLVLKLKKREGDTVEIGESVAVLEAMKMENEIRSPASGIIKEMLVKEGISVEKGELIFKIE